MKKHLALVLALVMVLTSFSFVSAAPDFSDMEGHANAEAVARLELLNVLKGYPDGSFKPDNTITRAEFAAVAVRVSGLENVATAAQGLPTGFTDVPTWHWASGYVGTAAQAGIVNGIGNGLFAPESPVKYEEAITMIVRALGYEPMAQARGGYPFGYLIVANEIDLLDGAMGTQGTWATRGFVAQITDNALEIPMMIQVGFGSDTKWVVSGSKEHDGDEVFLLDRMGFDSFEGRIADVDVEDLEIYIRDDVTPTSDSDTGWYDVAEGFDFYAVSGVKVKVWVDGDMVILAVAQEEVVYDAIDVAEATDEDYEFELTLVAADKDYDVLLDNDAPELEKIEYDYAKVVINDEGDVVWVDAIETLEFILVEEIDDYSIIDMNDVDEDLEDFLIVKDGKTISFDEIEEEDLVFYHVGEYMEEFDGIAIVYNEVVEAEVTRAYTTSFRLDGSTYYLNADAQVVEEGELVALEYSMMDDYVDEEVLVYLDFRGDVVILIGDKAKETTTIGAVLTSDANVFLQSRTGKYYIALDMVNEFGEEVSFDDDTKTTSGAILPAWAVVEYEIDEDGDLDDVNYDLDSEQSADQVKLETDDRYAEGYRLMSNTVVFLVDKDDEEVDEVFAWADADDYFGEARDYVVYYNDNNEVSYLVVFESDAGGDFDDVEAVVVKQKQLANGDLEVTFNIEGTEAVFDFETYKTTVGGIYTISVTDDYKDIEESKTKPAVDVETGTLEVVNARLGTFELTLADDSVLELRLARGAVIFVEDDGEYDAYTSFSRLADLGTNVTVLFDEGSSVFVKYIVD